MTDHHYLILGANGQLGKQFKQDLAARGARCSAPEESSCSITDADGIARTLDALQPSVVINCAAYNAVDAAEKDPETAFRVNAEAVGTLARRCNANGIRLVHYSSDYVFDGTKGDLYAEDDRPNPLNVYGKSKLAGEQAALGAHSGALVFRTSWVFGDGTQNFMYKLRGWAEKNRVLRISGDEVSVPTSTIDLVSVTLVAVEAGLSGLFHLTNTGYASRYEWGRMVLSLLRKDNIVIPVAMSEFPSPAKRPLFSAMSNQTVRDRLGVEIPSWQEAVEGYLKR